MRRAPFQCAALQASTRARNLFQVTILAAFWLSTASAQSIEQRIDGLLQKMTLEEKLGQMSQSTSMAAPISEQIKQQIRAGRWGSFLNAGNAADRAEAQRIATKETRLGIPLIFGRDVIHGYHTIFPIPLGQAASWDADLIREAAREAALEATAEGIAWTFAPMIDIARDPRWGRVAESLGEDPYVTSVLGSAMVQGFQGESLDRADSLAACAKHYVGYGAAEGGRDYNSAWIPEILLRDVYLRPFHAARDAGVATFMTAFNTLNAVPATGNRFLLNDILRGEWKFDGLVVSDYNAVSELVAHGYAVDARDAARKALLAGVDMEMVSTTYFDHLKSLLEADQVTMGEIDAAVRNILRLKFRLGLFDGRHPAADRPEADALATAERLATESVVLLKNNRGALPLKKTIGKVAVIGPLADSPADQMGTWSMDGDVSG
ncbi:MAG TPA: glycoside hydrolase family 3 N-terminal domain-containing protein, partial [Bryobacteraceae bacterium]|nr:glycoside hydrolase family 3 N-terminal domain-containing protein [Bryobacteraceae bacterium]